MREDPSQMAHQIPLAKLKSQTSPSIIPLLQDQESKEISQTSKNDVEQGSTSRKRHENGESSGQETAISAGQNSTAGDANVDAVQTPPPPPAEDSGRERLKKHRVEVAGHVWIPDIWGQEELLQDWIDCSAFDASLFPSGIMSARSALVEEGRRENSGRLRIENRC